MSSPANATVVANDQYICAHCAFCGLFRFHHDGDVVWEHRLPVSQRFNGSDNSLLLAGDRVPLNCEDTRDRYLILLSAGTGEQW